MIWMMMYGRCRPAALNASPIGNTATAKISLIASALRTPVAPTHSGPSST